MKHSLLYWAGMVMVSCFCSVHSWASTNSNQHLWQGLHLEDHFVIIRHALAPGTGDPENFNVNQRATQRNLSQEGEQQARYLGQLFRQQGIEQAKIFSSEWYRCRDSARLMELGPVTPLPALNSFYQNYGKKQQTTNALIRWLSEHQFQQPLILVTHQVNITALTGVYPASGELVFVKKTPDQPLQVLGTIKTGF